MKSEADRNGSAEQVAGWKMRGGCDELELIKVMRKRLRKERMTLKHRVQFRSRTLLFCYLGACERLN